MFANKCRFSDYYDPHLLNWFSHLRCILQLMVGFDLPSPQLKENTFKFNTIFLYLVKSIMNMSLLLFKYSKRKNFLHLLNCSEDHFAYIIKQQGCAPELESLIIRYLTQCHCHFAAATTNCPLLFSEERLMSDRL